MQGLTPRPSAFVVMQDESNTAAGVQFIAVAALLYSLIPVALDFLVDGTVPLTVGFGTVIGYIVALEIDRRRLAARVRNSSEGQIELSYRNLLRHIVSPSTNRVGIFGSLLVLTAAVSSYVIFAASTVKIDTAVSSSLYELWPMLWLFAMRRVDASRYGPSENLSHPWHTYALMLLGVPAIALIIFSTAVATSATDAGVQLPVAGIVLGIAAPIMGTLIVATFWFTDRVLYEARSSEYVSLSPKLYDRWMKPGEKGLVRPSSDELRAMQVAINHASLTSARVVLLVILLPLAVRESGSIAQLLSGPLFGGILIGALLAGPAGISVSQAHYRTNRREIVSLQYLSPVLALLWLAVATPIDIARIDFLVIGTVAVVAINMLINLDPETKKTPDELATSERERPGDYIEPRRVPLRPTVNERHSLRALVLALLVSGSIIYFREDIFETYSLEWIPGNYWAALALASTVFALLLAFRLTRVESLLVAEDYRTLSLLRRIEMLPDSYFGEDRPDSKGFLLDWIRLLNKSDTLSDYRRSYNQAHRALHCIVARSAEGLTSFSYDERREMAEIRTELDVLAHGRQHAREFAERIALWLIGAVIVALTLSVPPEPLPWARFMADMLAIVLSSVVVFLLAHMADLRRSRADELVRDKDPEWDKGLEPDAWFPEGLYIRFREATDTVWQRIVAALIIVGIMSTFVLVLAWDRLAL